MTPAEARKLAETAFIRARRKKDPRFNAYPPSLYPKAGQEDVDRAAALADALIAALDENAALRERLETHEKVNHTLRKFLFRVGW